MPDKSDLKFYLTSLEPNLLQVKASQSIGGYPSSTEYNPSFILDDSINLSDDSVMLNGIIKNPSFILIGEELMEVTSIVNVDNDYGGTQILSTSRGNFKTNKQFHAIGDVVYSSIKNEMFNGSISSNGQQYRCIAVKNMGSNTFYDLKFYIKNSSLNSLSLLQIGIETPVEGVFYSSSTGGTTISVIDKSIVNIYPDNYFNNRLLVISDNNSKNLGQSRIIASFDSATGIITFQNALPFPIIANTSYRIEQSPCQILNSGRTSPNMNSENTSSFGSAMGIQNAISINPNGMRVSGNDLKSFETVYLWFKRDVSTNTTKYLNNRFIFTATYRNT